MYLIQYLVKLVPKHSSPHREVGAMWLTICSLFAPFWYRFVFVMWSDEVKKRVVMQQQDMPGPNKPK